MPTSVIQIEFENIPEIVRGLDGYSHALILIKWRGCPVGQVLTETANGIISGLELREKIVAAALPVICDYWLQSYLGINPGASNQLTPAEVTIATCTRDRPEDLQRCLNSLAIFAEKGYEILVIDSCSSTDRTLQITKQYGFARYIREDRPGLNIARNRALAEARSEFVAFTDDDAVPEPDWVELLVRNFSDPLVLAVTGLVMPLELETAAQEWFERYSPFNRGFYRKVYNQRNCNPLSPGRVGAGANMAFRCKVLDCIGSFDEALDAGTPTCSGGETEMFSRILAGGYRIVYEPAALSWHRHRRTWPELKKAIRGYGVGVYAFWSRRLLEEHELGVLPIAWHWFFHYQLRQLAKALLRKPASFPIDLLWSELCGCAAGPHLFLQSRQQFRRNGKNGSTY